MADPKRSALGKGLSALIPDAPEPRAGITELDIDLLRSNEYQPRQRVDDDHLEELAAALRNHLPDNDRDATETGLACGAPAALARDDLV